MSYPEHLYPPDYRPYRPSKEPPFYWQREHLFDTDVRGYEMPQRSLIEAMMYAFGGATPEAAREIAEIGEEAYRVRRIKEGGWTPKEWIELLSTLEYKPGWHCQIIIDYAQYYPRVCIGIDAVVDLPPFALSRRQQCLSSNILAGPFVRDEKHALWTVQRALEEMEDKIHKEWLRRDGLTLAQWEEVHADQGRVDRDARDGENDADRQGQVAGGS